MSNEAGEIRMFEVEWEDEFLKLFNVFDEKGVAMRRPANDRIMRGIVEDVVGFFDEVAHCLVQFRERMPHLQGNKNKENN